MMQLPERIFARFFEAANEGMMITDQAGTILKVNEALCRISGYAREDLLGRNPRVLKSGAHDAAFYRTYWDSILRDGHWVGEIVNRKKNGDLYTALESISSVLDERGRISHYMAVQLDLTEQKRKEERLRFLYDSGRLLTATLHLDDLLTAILDEVQRVVPAKRAAVFLYDPERQRLVFRAGASTEGSVFREGLAFERGDCLIWRAFEERRPFYARDHRTFCAPFLPKMIRNGVLSALHVPLLCEGECLGVLFVGRGVADAFLPDEEDLLVALSHTLALAIRNAQLFEKVEARSRELQKALRLKEEFLSNLTHELRTPLTPLLGYLELLLEKDWEGQEKRRGYVERAWEGARRLHRLIADLLDLAALQAGRVEWHVEAVDPGPLIEEVCGAFAGVAERKQIALKCHGAAGERRVLADVSHFRKVLSHLVDNAVKFTPEGGWVEIGTTVSGGDMLEVVVEDSGIGIPHERHAELFDLFRQDDGSPTRRHGGLGIGLALCKRLVEGMGGSIKVSANGSHPGTRVRLTLPAWKEEISA